MLWSYQNTPGTPPNENIITIPNGQRGDQVKVSLPESTANFLSLAEVVVMNYN